MRRLKMKKPEVKILLGLYLQDRIWQTPSRQLKSGLHEWNMENGFFKGKFFYVILETFCFCCCCLDNVIISTHNA